MNLHSWKHVGELVGMAAILAGIYFVYAEIRQNSVIARAELSSQTVMQLGEIDNQFLDPEFSALYLKSTYSPLDLSEAERLQLGAFFGKMARLMIWEYRNYSFGLFAEHDLIPRYLARRYLSYGYGRAWWNSVGKRIDPIVAAIVNEELAKDDSYTNMRQLEAEILDELKRLQ